MTLRKHDRINRNYAASRTRCLRSELLECRNLLSVSPVQTAAEEVSPTAFFSFDAETIDGGTLYGGEIIEAGAVDKAISLDGVDDYFALEASEDLQIEGEITIAAWVKPESKTGVQDIIAHGYTRNPNAEVFLRISGGQYQIGSWNGSNHMISVDIPTSDIGSWVHLCGTYDGTHWRLYRNGELAGILEDSVGAVTVNADWTVGASMNGTDRFFRGVIDEVNIFDQAISEEMIADLAVRTADKPAGSWTALMDDDGLMYDSASDTTGQLRNGAEWAYDPEFGSVLDLTGNNGSVLLGDPGSLQIEGKITLAAWVKPESTDGYNYILAKGFSQSPNGEICLRINDGKYEVGSWNGTSYYAAFDVPEEDLGTWVYLCGTYDGEYWRLYRNGEEVAALQSTVGAISVNSDWSIGSTGNGTQRFFNGQIKQVQLYDTAVTPAQIADMYSAIPTLQMSSQAAPVSFGGSEEIYVNDEYRLYFYNNNYSDVTYFIDWGDPQNPELTEFHLTESEGTCTHTYSQAGDYEIRIESVILREVDENGISSERRLGVYENNIQRIKVKSSPVIRNNSFNEIESSIEGEGLTQEEKDYLSQYNWALTETLPGWSGLVEIRSDGKVELDADQYQPPEKPSGEQTGMSTSITSDTITLEEGKFYQLSFVTNNRSQYAADNILSVTCPGKIVAIDNMTVPQFLNIKMEHDLAYGTSWHDHEYTLVSLANNDRTLRFSTGGSSYSETEETMAPYHVTSVIFQADSSSGRITLADGSYDNVVPTYGQFVMEVNITPVKTVVDIAADYENQGHDFNINWQMRNNRLESISTHPGYVIPMSDNTVTESNHQVYIDCQGIDPLLYDTLNIEIYASEQNVVDFAPIKMTLREFVSNYGPLYEMKICGIAQNANQTVNLIARIYSSNQENMPTSADEVKVTTTLFIMGDHTDYGQLLRPELNTNYMWDCDLANNTYKTPKSEGLCYEDGVQTGDVGYSYLESALTYYDGFTMNYSYTFDRSYGDDDYGYVQAKNSNGTNKGKKLSFVGNGGIKYGGESGSFEAAIFDVRAMVAMILNDTSILDSQTVLTEEQIFELASKIDAAEAAKGNLKISNTSYASEPITKLLDAVGYGENIAFIYNEHFKEVNLQNMIQMQLAYILAYGFEITPVGQTVRLCTEPISTYLCEAKSISMIYADTVYLLNEDAALCNIPRIYLQAHWGSGVTYSILSVE